MGLVEFLEQQEVSSENFLEDQQVTEFSVRVSEATCSIFVVALLC